MKELRICELRAEAPAGADSLILEGMPIVYDKPTTINDPAGKYIEIIVSIKGNLPKTQSKYEFRSASALIIESNVGVEVLGATFSLPKRGLFG